jgi:hypothetical protein
VPQNAIDIELCLRITTGKLTLAPWKCEVDTKSGKIKRARSIVFGVIFKAQCALNQVLVTKNYFGLSERQSA